MDRMQFDAMMGVLTRIADALEGAGGVEKRSSSGGAISQKQAEFIRELREKVGDTSTAIPETTSEAHGLIQELIAKRDAKPPKEKERARPRREPEPEPEEEDRSDIDPERNARMIREHMIKMGWVQ